MTEANSALANPALANPAFANQTVVITGASSGVGLEAAAQFAQLGYGRVVVTARSESKAQQAVADLQTSTGLTVFAPLTLDLDDFASVNAAADALIEQGQVDVLVLNAGMPPTPTARRTADNIEGTVSATLTGHHLLTVRLLDAKTLADQAHILIAGSEAARGDVPMMNPMDIDRLAAQHFDGDRERTIEAVMRLEPPFEYNANDQYATTKVFAAWWAAELARRLPSGMTASAVSPGNTPSTGAVTKMSAFTRIVLVPIMKLMPGMSQSVAAAAGRYVEASTFGPETSGAFYASKPKKLVGPMVRTELPHIDDAELQSALWRTTERVVRPEHTSTTWS